MASIEELKQRQKALAQFGAFVLDHDDLQGVLEEACRIIAFALGVDLSKVIQIERNSNTGLVRAGYGWKLGVVGKMRVDLDERSSEAYAIEKGEPVITNDLAQEERFHFPEFLRDHGVVALVNVPIFLPGRKPWGILQVDAKEPRTFGEEDIDFLRTYAMILGPVVDRLETVSELSATDERLRLIAENARDYVIVLSDPADRITDWLGGSAEILGWAEDEVLGKTTSLLFTQQDRDEKVPERELSEATAGGTAANVRWHLRKDGSRVFLDGHTVALKDLGGEVQGFLKIAQDVTSRKRAQEHQAVLLAELQHRVRNILAVIRSMVRRTHEEGQTAEEFIQHLEGRLGALARTQVLLTRTVDAAVDLDMLIRDELVSQASDDDEMKIEGPEVKLAPKAAEVLTLAIHELTTNSVKYGALSQPRAEIEISWNVEQRGGCAWLSLSWSETGVPIVPSSPLRRGFGTELITQRVAYELRGTGTLKMGAGGIRCTLEFPLEARPSILQTDEYKGHFQA
ncbi:sensor histidine kinase [Sphingomonas sp. M1-B02]|uniref:sensor histidine kinase n=1 Tax=Sphingomonas sp. M1-B02 TaxID=3114300 RepID=UPI00223F85A4|nr:HWE histidine kinase domain-containing protein [Sphingomonas sp. S6-11]UZK67790.1 PAS domain S-box protein [Sphingomonas sp. S6-11]